MMIRFSHSFRALHIVAALVIASTVFGARVLAAKPTNAEQVFQQGEFLRHHQHYQEALQRFELAIRIDPKYMRPYKSAAETLTELENPREAIQIVSKGIELMPKEGWLWYTRSNAYYCVGDLAKSRSDIDKAVALDPKNPHFYAKRADFDCIAHDYQKGLKDYYKTIELTKAIVLPSPDYDKKGLAEVRASAHKDIGNVYKTLGKYQQAADEYTQALDIPEPPFHTDRVLADRAICYDKLGKHDLAAKDRKVVEQHSGNMLDDMLK